MTLLRLLLLSILLSGCSGIVDNATFECARSEDCGGAALCLAGQCASTTEERSQTNTATWGTPEHAETTGATATPRVAGPCAAATIPPPGSLVINEVLANPPAGDAGDANGDGTRDPYQDEFVEIVNVSDGPVELGGAQLFVDESLRHTFEPLCILSGAAVVIFGGGMIGPTVVGPALISDRRLGLPNDAGKIEFIAGGVHETVSYSRSPAASMVRSPELIGTTWVSHVDAHATPYSPGTCGDGSALSTKCLSPSPSDGESPDG